MGTNWRRIYRILPATIRYNLWGRWFQLWEKLKSRRWNASTSITLDEAHLHTILANLARLLPSGPGPSVWFLPRGTWYSAAFQRPQQMAKALAEEGCQVVYCEPWRIGTMLTYKGGHREQNFVGLRRLSDHLHLLRCPPVSGRELLRQVRPDAILFMWPNQVEHLPDDTGASIIYEMVDSHDLVEDVNDRWREIHARWIREADVMVVTAVDLKTEVTADRPDTLLLPNGVNIEDWRPFETPLLPRDLATARRARVVVGYHGAIAPWFDWQMWDHAARSRPDWSFVLIGPIYELSDEVVKQRIQKFKNVYYLGSKKYHELPSYTAHFDIATIPFVLNKVTHACSPIKLFEYMATGKPIVASPMREILQYQSVLTADDPETFVRQLDRAVALADDAQYLATLNREAGENTWRARATTLLEAVERARQTRNGETRTRVDTDETARAT